MRYFLDFEFIEGRVPQTIFGINISKWLSRPNNVVQPISIGIVNEDEKEFYAIYNDFNLYEAWNRCQEKVNVDYKPSFGSGNDSELSNPMYIKEYWLRENILRPLFNELVLREADKWTIEEDCDLPEEVVLRKIDSFNYRDLKLLITLYGKSSVQIADQLKWFIAQDTHNKDDQSHTLIGSKTKNPVEFYGYFCDYDWVCFCQTFGLMISLPRGYPKFCYDLKQLMAFKDKKNNFKQHPNYPKQENEHNALEDAKWNLELYKFITTLK